MSLTQQKAGARTDRRLALPSAVPLDVKFGFRMLVKYPGLTIVGGLAMAFGIATGAATFEAVRQIVRPALPLAEGDRIVGLQQWDAAAQRVEERTALELLAWRDELRTVRELGAYRSATRNLVTGEGRGEPVLLAEVTASAFPLTRVPPLLGRALGARRSGTHSACATGKAKSSGITPTTVTAAPPRRTVRPTTPASPPKRRRQSSCPSTATAAEAQAELATVGARLAARFPDTHAQLRPRVVPYARAAMELPEIGAAGLAAINVFVAMLLVLSCGNVALLTFARAATRDAELVVRSALGASRARIVVQLFAESLVLAGAAAVAGLGAGAFALRVLMRVLESEAGGRLPFWFDDRLSPATLLYTAALTVLAAAIAGIWPALKVTGRGVQARLRQAAAGAGGLRLGGAWTAVIVAQIAVTVTFPATAFLAARWVVRVRSMDVGFPAERYLSARLAVDAEPSSGAPADTSAAAARTGATLRELERRLTAEPWVAGVTFTDRLPHTQHSPRAVEIDDPAVEAEPGLRRRVGPVAVDVDYFDVLGAPVRAGRAFGPADLAPGARAVIVNESFVRQTLGGRNPIGRRVRYRVPPGEAPQPWHEIVGVVKDLGIVADDPGEGAGVYHPAGPGSTAPGSAAAGIAAPLRLVIHVRGDPAPRVPRLRTLATEVDPALRLHDPLPLDAVGTELWTELAFLFRLLVVVSAVALLLSLAGIYAVMAFAVSRRTREIGVRVALGASRRGVVAAVFARPLAQVAGGIVAGAVLTGLVLLAGADGVLSATQLAALVGYAALMLGVCLLACVVPTRRALRVQPTEALRADG